MREAFPRISLFFLRGMVLPGQWPVTFLLPIFSPNLISILILLTLAQGNAMLRNAEAILISAAVFRSHSLCRFVAVERHPSRFWLIMVGIRLMARADVSDSQINKDRSDEPDLYFSLRPSFRRVCEVTPQ
eukprot:Protomagalhaensia_wolfi_Nauph_80__1481@NODE_1899_length_1285_cov_21_191011_g1486_i0_p1_GENE_NODE_1899_length_1285_cov_21_191011_g1486_i0NODE_1899_length_1285_cov_21_191011_g1486_i0_p1_ORF_typecomplete_len130_score8_00_NODE_1899_length_1285_cov_21_191011_g1486_i0368757